MKTIQDIVNSKVSDMIANGTIEAAIENGVQKAIESAIAEQFKTYGDMTKQITEVISNGLMINTKDLPFETYNQQMLVAVKSKLGNMFQGVASEKFLAEIDKTLAPAPAQMSLKELVETVVKFWREDDDDELSVYATVKVEPFHNFGKSLSMWKKENPRTEYSSTADLHLYISNGTIRINHSHHYNPTSFDDYEAFIFKCYAAGTVITDIEDFDADDCDLSLRDYED